MGLIHVFAQILTSERPLLCVSMLLAALPECLALCQSACSVSLCMVKTEHGHAKYMRTHASTMNVPDWGSLMQRVDLLIEQRTTYSTAHLAQMLQHPHVLVVTSVPLHSQSFLSCTCRFPVPNARA